MKPYEEPTMLVVEVELQAHLMNLSGRSGYGDGGDGYGGSSMGGRSGYGMGSWDDSNVSSRSGYGDGGTGFD